MQTPSAVAEFYQRHMRAALDASGKYLYDLMMPDDAQLRIFTEAGAMQLNADLDVEERLPGFFAVGDNAGDEILCVEIQTGRVVSVPLRPMKPEDALYVADSLAQIVANGVE